jgi:hypothetical protein
VASQVWERKNDEKRANPDSLITIPIPTLAVVSYSGKAGSDPPGEVRRLVGGPRRRVDVRAPLEFIEGQTSVEASLLVGVLRGIPKPFT